MKAYLHEYRISCPVVCLAHRKGKISVFFLCALSLFACSLSAFAQNWALTSAPTNNWSAIVGSADLTVLAATVDGGGIYYSTNAGTNWSYSDAPSNRWVSIACSSDGLAMIASANGGGIWKSTDDGASWTATAAATNSWTCVASSADGTASVASSANDLWITTNSGSIWSQLMNAPFDDYLCVACSSNCAIIEAGATDLWNSGDFGTTWSSLGGILGAGPWSFLAATRDGSHFADVEEGYAVWFTTNFWGFGWRTDGIFGALGWSGDGSRLVVVQNSLSISMYFDQVSRWVDLGAPSEFWTGLAVSTDGNRLTTASTNGGIYIWQPNEPVIVNQPQDETVLGGVAAMVAASAISTVSSAYAYQWQLNGVPLPDATNSALMLTNLRPSNAGTYTVLVSNSYGTTISSNAILTVVPAFVSTLSTDWGISDAILGGSVSTGSNSTVVWFNWGADTNYGNTTPAYPVSDGATSLNFSNRITGLTPYTTYHYQAVTSNALGVVLGGDATFATTPRFNLTSGTNGNWDSIGWSTNGGKIFASSDSALYLSTNSGADWLLISDTPLTSFIPSADGAKVAGLEDSIFYLTTNSGATWSSNSTPTNFSTFAGSGDLTKLVAVGGSQLYVSTNTGGAWSLSTAPSENWTSVASSADGTEFVALAVEDGPQFGEFSAGFIYVSTNSGATWSNIVFFGGETFVSSIACSGGGATLLMLGEFSVISNDSGRTWRPPQITIEAYNAAISSNGMTIVVVAGGEIFQRRVFVSPDFGVDWFAANAPVIPGPEPVLISSDGTKFAALNNGNIYISEPNPSPALTVAVMGNNLLLSWIVPTTNFVLQQSADLETWSTVTNAPSLNITNLQDQVLLPISQTQSFYRLKTL